MRCSGGSSVGETVDPGSASRAACPTIRSLSWGCRGVICPFFFSARKLSLISLVQETSVFPLSLPFPSLSGASGVHVCRVVSGRKKWARYLCQDNTGKHVHPCEREPKSVLRGTVHAALPPSWKLVLLTSNRLVL